MSSYQIAACTFEIKSVSGAIQLLPTGTFRARDGRPKDVASGYWLITAPVAQRLIRKAAERATDLVIDYEHQTLNSAENGQPAPAAGWFRSTSLEWREGHGLYAGQVQWTNKAAAMIAAREYRYLSPVFSYDKQTGEVLELHHVGLTNFPALDGMASLPTLAAARFRLGSSQTSHDARTVMGDLQCDIVALKGRQAAGKVQLDPMTLGICQAMGVSPEDYLKTLNESPDV
jgi:phage I-like protein